MPAMDISHHVTDLLQAGAQVAAEDEADPVYLHAVDAGLRVPFAHTLQVGFLLHKGSTTLSHIVAQLLICRIAAN